MTPALKTTLKEIVIRDLDGKTVTYPMQKDRIVLGRSSAVELCYPDDIGLSRQHLAIFKIGDAWQVEDLGSKNGTVVNGKRIERAVSFAPGDRISAGHLTIEFPSAAREGRQTVEFIENQEATDTSTTVVANLDGVLGPAVDDLNKTYVMQGSPQMRALIRAGRELAGHRSLDELFTLIVDLTIEAVMAGRGVLMTLEGDKLVARAARGDDFKISATVRDRVIVKKESLLIRDAQLDNTLRQHMSIVEQKVRSLIAVPLQTNDRVIGLIYVDTPHLIREFTREDLNLLTVMSNIAAIRIEHARLAEIEEAERQMAKDMQQAAIIQRQLLPSVPPPAPGLDIAGRTASCRTVGGDYYDYLKFADGKVGILVGDVAGKGMPAALLMSSLQARVHVVFEDAAGIAQKMTRLNKAVAANCPDNRFITFFLGIIDPHTGTITYSNAGHNPPVLVRAKGGFDLLEGGGIILGIMPAAPYQEFSAQLEIGDILVLFSDGVTEACNPHEEDFGEQRLADLVASMRNRPAREIVEKIHDAVAAFTEGAPAADDITVMVVRRTG